MSRMIEEEIKILRKMIEYVILSKTFYLFSTVETCLAETKVSFVLLHLLPFLF